MPRDTLERITGIVFLASFIAAQFLAGIVAALRVAGVACLVTALVWVIERSVPVGIEGRPPSFYLREQARSLQLSLWEHSASHSWCTRAKLPASLVG